MHSCLGPCMHACMYAFMDRCINKSDEVRLEGLEQQAKLLKEMGKAPQMLARLLQMLSRSCEIMRDASGTFTYI